MSAFIDKLRLEPKDIITIATIVAGILLHFGAFQARLQAVEKAVDPVSQMHIEIEVVKAAIVDMRDDIRTLTRRGR